jgi:hypothetical protein
VRQVDTMVLDRILGFSQENDDKQLIKLKIACAEFGEPFLPLTFSPKPCGAAWLLQ